MSFFFILSSFLPTSSKSCYFGVFFFCRVGYSVKESWLQNTLQSGKASLPVTKFLCPCTIRSQPLFPTCQECLRPVQSLNAPVVKKNACCRPPGLESCCLHKCLRNNASAFLLWVEKNSTAFFILINTSLDCRKYGSFSIVMK